MESGTSEIRNPSSDIRASYHIHIPAGISHDPCQPEPAKIEAVAHQLEPHDWRK